MLRSNLFLNRAIRSGTRLAGMRNFSTARPKPNTFLYDNIFKTNSRYLVFIFGAAAIGEFLYGSLWDIVWNFNNKGKLYDDIDWSKWKSIYLEEDEDDEDEEEEEEEQEEADQEDSAEQVDEADNDAAEEESED